MKDAKGHGSEKHGGDASAAKAPAYAGKPTWHGVMPGGRKVTNQAGNKISYASPEAAVAGAAHQAGVNTVGGQRQITIFHQDGEYAVPIPGNRGHSFTNDKADAESTARKMHGDNITIKHRAKSWGPEMD